MKQLSPLQKQHLTELSTALRSKKYNQGFGRLKGILSDGTITYCCLGVGAELCPNIHYEDYVAIGSVGKDSEFIPPLEAEEYYGLTLEVQENFSSINDSGAPFDKIAEMFDHYRDTSHHILYIDCDDRPSYVECEVCDKSWQL